jgi:hypothetical protein
MLTSWKNNLFFTFELNKRLVQKMLNLFKFRWLGILGNFGDPQGGKVYSSFPGE